MEIGLMIEGQNGLNWDRWRAILDQAEDLGFAAVFRSDHFTNPSPPDEDSLELWTSLTFAADHTSRIEFGSMVMPVTFRHPCIAARMAAAVDDLSLGRLVLGIGAGWQDREHHNFGISFPDVSTRYEMLTDYLEVVCRLLRSDDPVTYEGNHFQLHDAILLPRPTRSGGPRILVGGNGERRTMPIAAKYADEWNAVFVTPERFQELNEKLNALVTNVGREPSAVRRSLMTGTAFARDEGALNEKIERQGRDKSQLQQMGVVVATADTIGERLAQYAAAGVERLLLQWLELDNLEDLTLMASAAGVT